MWYKGSSRKLLESFLWDNDILDLDSRVPSDFKGKGRGPIRHLSPQRNVGVFYAKYKAHYIHDPDPVHLMKADIPSSLIEKHNPLIIQLQNNDEDVEEIKVFKQIVFNSRNSWRFPKHLSHLESPPLLSWFN